MGWSKKHKATQDDEIKQEKNKKALKKLRRSFRTENLSKKRVTEKKITEEIAKTENKECKINPKSR